MVHPSSSCFQFDSAVAPATERDSGGGMHRLPVVRVFAGFGRALYIGADVPRHLSTPRLDSVHRILAVVRFYVHQSLDRLQVDYDTEERGAGDPKYTSIILYL